MYTVRVCFEIAASAGLACDDQGNPCPVGAQITIGEALKEVPYEELAKDVKIDAVASMLKVDPEEVTIITPEEYDERYGDEE